MSDPVSEPRGYILVAEDSPPNRKILCHLIEKLGFATIGCENGEVAYQALTNGGHQNIVAIISDIMMPVMDGMKLLREVRAQEKYAHLPFVLVTALSDKESIVQAKLLNVNGYILKPVTFQRVMSKLEELFPDRKFPKIAV